ncbi:MAG: phosphatidylinositol mannoside acyltransferase [Actinomycetota bacterium]|nr:phosphatidylinositol mannoside acyltransferase [Actinomycetota bacterium]
MTSRRPADEGRLLQLVYYAYVAGSRLALALPERWAYGLAHSLGRLWWRLSKKRRAVVERNLARITGKARASPEVADLVGRAFESYARYWLETFRLVREDRAFFLDRFRCKGEEKIDEALARGKGAIVVVGHLGNWDAAGAWVGARGNTLVTVAEVLRPRRMFDFFVEHRARLGMIIHPAQSGVTTKLAEAVEDGAVVAILGDRDLKGTGIEVKFFGEPATFPPGAATIALRTGVPVLVAGVYSAVHEEGKRGWATEITGPLELPAEDSPTSERVEDLTRRIAETLESLVARHPEEWHVFQPFWKADLPRGSEDAQ